MKVLLHICCGVCASSVAERLLCQGHKITGFFYNPNIHPVDEYQKRLKAAKEVAREWEFELVEGPYDRQRWFELAKGKEYAPEGGQRCEMCFNMRLEKAYEYSRKKMLDAFTTTLTVSPFKDVTVVNNTGRRIGGERFICEDFKRKGGFERANELAHQWSIYRQNYCGCIYSHEEKLKKDKDRGKET